MRTLWLVLLLFAPLLHADTIVFTSGDSTDGATILGAQDGVLVYEVEGKRYRRRIAEVDSISRSDDQRDPDNHVRLISLNRDREHPANRLLTLAVTDTPDRMREPFVRVFVMEQGDRGERSVRVYQNSRRMDDPTTLYELPMINSASYRQITFLVPGTSPISWRIEVWVGGDLKTARTVGAQGLQDDWWRLAERPRRGPLVQVRAPEKTEEPAQTAAEETPESAVSVDITSCRVSPTLGQGAKAVFAVQYQLRSDQVAQAELPKVELFYVTEGQNRAREVKTASIDSSAGQLVDIGQAGVSRSVEYPLPPEIVINAANTQFKSSSDKSKSQLIFWRVQVSYKDEILAVKQGGDAKAGRSLPKDWWK